MEKKAFPAGKGPVSHKPNVFTVESNAPGMYCLTDLLRTPGASSGKKAPCESSIIRTGLGRIAVGLMIKMTFPLGAIWVVFIANDSN